MKQLFLALFLLLNVGLAEAGIITDTDIFTCNGTSCTLKYGMVITGTVGSGITIGSSVITGGTNGYILYNNAGVLGNLNLNTTLASPGPVGSTSPNTGSFTTLTSTSMSVSGTGGYVTSSRYSSSGTILTSGNFSLTAGGGGTWGVGSSVGSISGNDSGFTATVTTAGSPGSNPILTLTFADGAWPTTPFPTCGSWVTGTTLSSDIATSTTTTLALQFIGTPTTATAYTITCSWIHN